MKNDARATEIVDDFWMRRERGEEVDADDVVRAHPELAEELRIRFAALARLDREFAPQTAQSGARSLSGTKLGPYRLGAELGSGGMGTVYAATVEGRVAGLAAGERVALKVVHPHLFDREGFFRRFLREVEIGRRVRQENVVRTLDADAVAVDGAQVHFLVLEYVEGQTLRALAAEVGRAPEELCRHVGREIAKALAAIHAAGAVHRDVKPENVLITRENAVRLMDLGVARLDDEALRVSQTGAFVGSVRYAAPEQFGGGAIDGRADLYALGLVLYEMATGVHPFPGDDFHVVVKRQLTETARPAGEVNSQLSAYFEEVLRTLLAKEPQRRFASAAALLDVLTSGEKSKWWHDRSAEVRAETRRPLRRIRIPRETAVYGRDAELVRLRALYERASAGEGQVVLVEGEAGIGKSRLVDEFVARLVQSGEDVNFLFGGNDPGGAATASGAFATAYREQFGSANLEQTLAGYLVETPVLVPAFAALLRGEPAPAGTVAFTKDSLQTVFVHATRRLAAERTTIVLVEDLHFAPEEGRALFASLALAVPGHRVLLVGTARPGLAESWTANLERLPHASRIPLPRLWPKDLARLLVDAFRSERLAEELSFKIAAKSDGNPYFVFELLRGLREGQFIRQRPDGTWVTTQVIRDIEIPSTVKDLIGARIADLDAEEKDLLDVAACLGFEFDAGLVAVASGAALVPVLKRLARIESRHRLVRSAGERFVFDHHQVQETLYAALPPALAREYHAAIARAIEARCPAGTPSDGATSVELADHALRGGLGERARVHLDAALSHLERNHLNDAVIRLGQRALALPGLFVGEARCRLLLRLVPRQAALGRRADEFASIEEATALADAAGDVPLRAAVRTARAAALVGTAKFQQAMPVLAESLELAHACGDVRAEANAARVLGVANYSLDRFAEAKVHLERSIALSRESDYWWCEASATGSLGNVLQRLGRYAESCEHHERQGAVSREHDERQGEAIAEGNLGVVLSCLGRFEESLAHHERQLLLARSLGYRILEAAVTGNIGNALWDLARSAEAKSMLERALMLDDEIGDRRSKIIVLSNLGNFLNTLGEDDRARETLELCVRLATETGMRRELGVARVGLAENRCRAGRTADALRLLDQALAVWGETGDIELVPYVLLARGRIRAADGDVDSARADFLDAAERITTLGLRGEEVLVAALLASLPGGDAEAARRAYHAHRADLCHVVHMEVAYLLWKSSGDHALLAEAKRLLDYAVERSPPESRAPMVANVPIHRDIAAAAREHLAEARTP